MVASESVGLHWYIDIGLNDEQNSSMFERRKRKKGMEHRLKREGRKEGRKEGRLEARRESS